MFFYAWQSALERLSEDLSTNKSACIKFRAFPLTFECSSSRWLNVWGRGPVTSEVNEHRGAGIKTRVGHAFALKGYSSLLFIFGAVRAAFTRARFPRGRQAQQSQRHQEKTMHGRISQKCQSAVTEAAEWGRKHPRQQRSCTMPNQKNSKGKKSKRSNSNGDEQENGGCAAAAGGAAAAAAPRSHRSSGKRGSGHRWRSLVMLCCRPGRGATAPSGAAGSLQLRLHTLDRWKSSVVRSTWGLVRIKWMDSGRRWLCEPASSTDLRSVLVRGYRATAAVCYDTRRAGKKFECNPAELKIGCCIIPKSLKVSFYSNELPTAKSKRINLLDLPLEFWQVGLLLEMNFLIRNCPHRRILADQCNRFLYLSQQTLLFSVCSQQTLHRPVRSRASWWPCSRVILTGQLYLCTVFEQITPPNVTQVDCFGTLSSHLYLFPFLNCSKIPRQWIYISLGQYLLTKVLNGCRPMGSNGADIRNQSADIFDGMCQLPEGDSRTMPVWPMKISILLFISGPLTFTELFFFFFRYTER